MKPGSVVLDECKRLRKSILPISKEYYGPLEKIFRQNTLYPFVLLLGNHSSGKSSFINYLLHRKIQSTGVAPTDDNFTIIAPGEEDFDRNGPAFIGDPDLGFSDLKVFGPVLVNHTQLKVRSSIAIEDFMIVDSPGMIDSPANSRQLVSNDPKLAKMDRGYDFETVCRWYAERADVILLFFDPDKPGTTGETLSILTNSLVGLDHKLFIILNKADQFCRIHDFARAYGSLCWNLSKVITRKDLPRIYTMCLPNEYITESENISTDSSSSAAAVTVSGGSVATIEGSDGKLSGNTSKSQFQTEQSHSGSTATDKSISSSSAALRQTSFYKQGILDLEESRTEVVKEVYNAPKRRVDNEISRLFESSNALLIHCKLLEAIVRDYNYRLWKYRITSALTVVASIGLTVGVNYLCDWIHSTSTVKTESVEPPPPTTTTSTTVTTPAAATSTPSTGKPYDPKPSNPVKSAKSSHAQGKGASSTEAGKPLPSFLQLAYHYLNNFITKLSYKQVTVATTACFTSLGSIGFNFWQYRQLKHYLLSFDKRPSYEAYFHKLYAKEIQANDQFHLSLGKVVIDQLLNSLNSSIIPTVPFVKKADIKALEKIIEEDIADLRRRASPNFPQIEVQSMEKGSSSPPTGEEHRSGKDEDVPNSFFGNTSAFVREPILLKPSDITSTIDENTSLQTTTSLSHEVKDQNENKEA